MTSVFIYGRDYPRISGVSLEEALTSQMPGFLLGSADPVDLIDPDWRSRVRESAVDPIELVPSMVGSRKDAKITFGDDTRFVRRRRPKEGDADRCRVTRMGLRARRYRRQLLALAG